MTTEQTATLTAFDECDEILDKRIKAAWLSNVPVDVIRKLEAAREQLAVTSFALLLHWNKPERLVISSA
jgi:hypothetical protein